MSDCIDLHTAPSQHYKHTLHHTHRRTHAGSFSCILNFPGIWTEYTLALLSWLHRSPVHSKASVVSQWSVPGTLGESVPRVSQALSVRLSQAHWVGDDSLSVRSVPGTLVWVSQALSECTRHCECPRQSQGLSLLYKSCLHLVHYILNF